MCFYSSWQVFSTIIKTVLTRWSTQSTNRCSIGWLFPVCNGPKLVHLKSSKNNSFHKRKLNVNFVLSYNLVGNASVDFSNTFFSIFFKFIFWRPARYLYSFCQTYTGFRVLTLLGLLLEASRAANSFGCFILICVRRVER